MNKGGRPLAGTTKALQLDLAGGWLPPGVQEDDGNREVCRQLRVMWTRLTARQQKVVMLFTASPDPDAIAKAAGFSGKGAAGKVEEELTTPVVRQVMHLRAILLGGTLPTLVSRRILASVIMGTHPTVEVTGPVLLNAIKLNALLGGEMVPEVKPEELPAGSTADATREEGDRIMRATLGAENLADLFRKRSKEAAKERADALRIDVSEGEPAPTPVSALSKLIASR